MEERIKIHLGKSLLDVDATNRVWYSDGTSPASSASQQKQNYAADAIIPKLPWRKLSASDFSSVVKQPQNQEYSGDFISIIRIPEEILEPFLIFQLASKSYETAQEIRTLRERDEIKIAVQKLTNFISPLRVSETDTMDGIGIAVNPPGLITTTYDYQNEQFIGLHLDSWYRASLDDRQTSPNRICINLGSQDRFFLFVDLPIKTIFARLEKHFPDDRRRYYLGRGLGLTFMEAWSDYPITRLRIAPHEAYIAPTENIIHDGSTADNTCFDVNLTIRSRFSHDF